MIPRPKVLWQNFAQTYPVAKKFSGPRKEHFDLGPLSSWIQYSFLLRSEFFYQVTKSYHDQCTRKKGLKVRLYYDLIVFLFCFPGLVVVVVGAVRIHML